MIFLSIFKIVKAEDPEGLANTATVTITVGDINDKNPEFVGLPYSFRVDEGLTEAIVGTVTVRHFHSFEESFIFWNMCYSVYSFCIY